MSFCCYLLQSLSDPSKTYIGYTNNAYRRLTQHNGLIAGGARRTVTHRPWRVVVTVYPFTRTAALQFEYRWSHFGNLQNVRPQRRNLQRQLEVLGHTLQATEFYLQDITIEFADEEVANMFSATSRGNLYSIAPNPNVA